MRVSKSSDNGLVLTADGSRIRSVGLFGAVSFVVGSMLGIGIFIVPPEVAGLTPNLGFFFGVWAFGGLVALAGADCFAELGSAYPRAGGDFAFQRQAFGSSVAFATGCVLFIGVFGGSIAAVAVPLWNFQISALLGQDLTKLQFELGWFTLNASQIGAVFLVAFITFINTTRARNWSAFQVFLTTIPVLILTALAIYILTATEPVLVPDPVQATVPWSDLTAAYLGVYFAYSGWNAVIYIAGEVKKPGRVIPRALVGGTLLVTVLYALICCSFVHVLGLTGLSGAGEAGTHVAQKLGHAYGANIVAVLVASALLASLNATISGGARIAYAMAKDGALWSKLAEGETDGVPKNALWAQAFWAMALILTGSFEQLIQLTGLAMLITGSLTVVALIKLRRDEPDTPRPYRSFCYPLMPAFYLCVNVGVIAFKLVEAFEGKQGSLYPIIGVFILGLAFLIHLSWRRLRHVPA